MEKNSRNTIVNSICFLLVFLQIGCGTYHQTHQLSKHERFCLEMFNHILKKYGNVFMIESDGYNPYTEIWYYNDKQIYVTGVSHGKIFSNNTFHCDSVINIREYDHNNKDGVDKALDAELLTAAVYDKSSDSIYRLKFTLEVEELKRMSPQDPFLKKLKEHIIKYNILVRTPITPKKIIYYPKGKK